MRTIAQQGTDFVINEFRVAVAAASSQFLKPDPTRVAVVFSCPAGSPPVFVANAVIPSVNPFGIIVIAGANPLQFTFANVGSWVFGPLNCQCGAGGQLCVLEILYRPSGQHEAEVIPVVIDRKAD